MTEDAVRFPSFNGPLITATLIAIHFILAHAFPSLRSVTSLLLLAVAYSTYRGGLRSGVISGALVFAYLAYDLSNKSFLEYNHIELERIGSFLLVIPGIVGLVRSLRLRAIQSELERELLLEREQARLALERYAAELERQVAQRTEELAKVSTRIAHDLRGALIQVLRYAELLETEFPGELPPDMRRFIRRIRLNGLQMERLVDELLRRR